MGSRVSRLRIILASSAAVVIAVGGGLYGHERADAATAPWVPVWSANFSGAAGSGLNSTQWSYQTGYGIFGTGEIETMTDSPRNVHLDGSGDLDITALKQGSAWTSGRIVSTKTFTPPAGGELMVTASIKQPNPTAGLGYWPAFWLLGQGSWPAHGEIDIMEDVDAYYAHSGTFHCGNLTTRNTDGTLGPCHEYNGLSSYLLPCSDCKLGFHTYSAIVDLRNPRDGQIDWYLDGQQFFSVQQSRLGADVWDEAINHGFSIILDLAMGGSYPNGACGCYTPTRATTSGGTMIVKDLAVYDQPS